MSNSLSSAAYKHFCSLPKTVADIPRETRRVAQARNVAHAVITPDRLLTPLQVAEALQVTPNTLAEWRRQEKRGPSFVKLPSGAVRYRLSSVTDFLARLKTSSGGRKAVKR